ncbi:hypothetical protein MRB53_041338 [Persea americana]|nr:hypothetical protein MRB53_041338 [Persea americana]
MGPGTVAGTLTDQRIHTSAACTARRCDWSPPPPSQPDHTLSRLHHLSLTLSSFFSSTVLLRPFSTTLAPDPLGAAAFPSELLHSSFALSSTWTFVAHLPLQHSPCNGNLLALAFDNMPRFSDLSLLALATTVLAVPHDHQNHARFHSHSASGSATGSWASSGLNATGYASNSSAWSGKHTKTATKLHTSTTTVCVTETETITPVSVASIATSSEDTCPTEYTTTLYSQTTVYVTQGQSITAAADSSSAASSSIASSSVASSSIATSSVASSSTAESAPLRRLLRPLRSAWTPSSSSSSSIYVAPPTTSAAPATSEAAPASSSASSASSAPAASSSAASSGSGKRGLAYNVASYTTDFIGAPQISWAYNWGSESQGLSSDIDYIPMLWCPTSTYTDTWSEVANTAISNGATTLFASMNLTSRANVKYRLQTREWLDDVHGGEWTKIPCANSQLT